MYPFGRRKFEFELVPLLEAVAALGTDRPCGRLQPAGHPRAAPATGERKHDERALSPRLNALVRRDRHARRPGVRDAGGVLPAGHPPLRVPVHYTGFVAPPGAGNRSRTGFRPAGGLLRRRARRRAAAARRGRGAPRPVHPYRAAGTWWPGRSCPRRRAGGAGRALAREERSARGSPARVPDPRRGARREATVSVSQCGYNTALEVLPAPASRPSSSRTRPRRRTSSAAARAASSASARCACSTRTTSTPVYALARAIRELDELRRPRPPGSTSTARAGHARPAVGAPARARWRETA